MITRRADYAIRMMLALAAGEGGRPLSVRSLAAAQAVPYAFARSVQRDLASAGLVVASRGAGGGLRLARPAADVTLLEIVEATQATPSVAVCASDPEWCGRSGSCSVHDVWREADALLLGHLGSKTLAGLVPTHRE